MPESWGKGLKPPKVVHNLNFLGLYAFSGISFSYLKLTHRKPLCRAGIDTFRYFFEINFQGHDDIKKPQRYQNIKASGLEKMPFCASKIKIKKVFGIFSLLDSTPIFTVQVFLEDLVTTSHVMVSNHISSVNKKVQRRKTSHQTWRTREVKDTSFVLQKKEELLFKL